MEILVFQFCLYYSESPCLLFKLTPSAKKVPPGEREKNDFGVFFLLKKKKITERQGNFMPFFVAKWQCTWIPGSILIFSLSYLTAGQTSKVARAGIKPCANQILNCW